MVPPDRRGRFWRRPLTTPGPYGTLRPARTTGRRLRGIPRSRRRRTAADRSGDRLNSPYGPAVDPAATLYSAAFDNDRVAVLPVRGGGQRTLPVAGLHTPAGLAALPPPGRDGC
ncbi:hypothetical protein ACFY9Q_31600 [Streptomyces sp. NPDC012389]|uniref:hypothetical protein n=1 Tax=Streptomyces sp. NPDC012389 TaxID=3364830 RepID=UPI0036DFA86A